MTVNRADIRKQFATFLRTYLVGVDKPADALYEYQVGDFRGRKIVTIVTGAGTDRRNPSSDDNNSTFYLEVHNFVLYAIKPEPVLEDLEAGDDVVLSLRNTALFSIGDTVTVEDGTYTNVAIVTDLETNTSITLDTLANDFTGPTVSIWTELQSEDMIDLMEQLTYDAVVDANDEDKWLWVSTDGRSEPDLVDIGGNPYRHEIIPVMIGIPELLWQL
jgi:hypothetical protein